MYRLSEIPFFSIFTIVVASLMVLRGATLSRPKQPSIKLKLIHVDSRHSPFYEEDTTSLQRSQNALRSSQLRVKILNAQCNNKMHLNEDVEFQVIPQRQAITFLVRLDIGTPPVSQLLSLDTGSKLTWVFCPPCNFCDYPPLGLYDPTLSSTMSKLDCNGFCRNEVPRYYCPKFDLIHCYYEMFYGKSAESRGNVVEDVIRIADNPRAIFGCSGGSKLGRKFSGLLGLGYGNVSIISQWGYKKFSYCLNNISDINDESSLLMMGDNDIFGGDTTPLNIIGSHYHVTPIDMDFGGMYISMDLGTFGEGLIIDTSSTLTYFPLEVVKEIEEEVIEVIGESLLRVCSLDYRLCYNGYISRDLKSFPVLTIQLAGDADFVLPPENMFWSVGEWMFCLAIVPNLAEGANILGALAQQQYAMAYDLELRTLRFEYMSCDTLDDT